MTRPNIIFFFTDDQRFDTLAALGNPDIHTPNLDALIATGTTFTQTHIPGGTSGAVCMPSRAMLHTGRTLFHLQDEGQEIPAAHTLLGEHLQQYGYDCYGIGKWHNGRAAFNRSFNDGNEIFFGGMEDHWNVPAYHYDVTGQYDNRLPFIRDAWHDNTLEWKEADHIANGRHSTDLFGDTAVKFLQERTEDTPFFLYVSLMAPHDPRTMPPEFLNLYDPDKLTLPANVWSTHPFDIGVTHVRDERLAAYPRTEAEVRQHVAEYYAMISHLDAQFGRIFSTLKQTNQLDNSIIVFSGDNGLALGQHGLMGKQNLYDHSLRVPLVFAGPGIPKGEKRDTLCYLLDIFPTLCDLLDLPIPVSVEGHSLAGCLKDKNQNTRGVLYLAYTDLMRGVRWGSYKLIEYASGQTQLFNLSNDPAEQHNLAPERPERTAGLRSQLLALRDAWDDLNHQHGATFWHKRTDL